MVEPDRGGWEPDKPGEGNRLFGEVIELEVVASEFLIVPPITSGDFRVSGLPWFFLLRFST